MSKLEDLLAELDSPDAEAAEAAAAALPAEGETGLAALALRLRGADAEQRWWAARSLAGFSQPAAGELLTGALADAESVVRQCAALSLSRRPHAAASLALVGLLAAQDSLEARLAGDALVALGAGAVEPLIAALGGDQLNAKVEAARALALIGDTRAVPALFHQLDSDSAVLEHWVSEGLEKMGVGMSFFQP
jgi:HEAT repeat protein